MASSAMCAHEETFVEYFLFPLIENKSSESELTSLHHIWHQISRIVEPFVENYIWYKDEFNLEVRPSNFRSALPSLEENTELPAHFYGITRYGENIDDEYFIVFLLMRLTENMPGLVARVTDSECTEILLIEAAELIPNWEEMEKKKTKVLIYQGDIHLVPHENESNMIDKLRRFPQRTKAPDTVQDCIRTIVDGFRYPEILAAKCNLQVNAILPAGIRCLLSIKPSVISKAIHEYLENDAEIEEASEAESNSCSIVITKWLLAKILMSDERAGWHLPPRTDPEYQSHVLGKKITVGFDILVSQVKETSASKQDLEADKGWHTYKQSLIKNGYFKELIEGSKEYSSMEERACSLYVATIRSVHKELNLPAEINNPASTSANGNYFNCLFLLLHLYLLLYFICLQ